MSRQSLQHTLARYWQNIQTTLFPFLEQAGLPLTPQFQRLVAILDLLRIEELTPKRLFRVGAKPKDRILLARAFLAKHFLNQPDTKAFHARLRTDDTLRRICGWPSPTAIPCYETFTRAFAVFADLGLADLVHDARVKEWFGDTLIWHQALDATDIPARERANPNPEPQYGYTASGKRRKHPLTGRPKGRPKKDEEVEKPQTRIERQLAQTPEIALLDIPMHCDTGCKPDPEGHLHHWKGYKFHVITNEDRVPLCAITTAASVHDSQAAIPLMKLTARRVTALYDLQDSGYDAAAIRTCSQQLRHVPIIKESAAPNAPAPEMEPDRARHYMGRTVAEHFNARLKDEAGGRMIRVRGIRKVHMHLMFGLLVIFADALLNMAT